MNESTFERRPLPRYFAVLRPTSGGGPSYQFCEAESELKILPFDPSESDYVMIIKNAEIPIETLKTLERKHEDINADEDKIFEYRMRNHSQSDIDIRKVKYWHLPHYFFWNEYHIPVLDFNKRFFLTRSFSRVIPPNTDMDSMTFTAMNYNHLRERRITRIPMPQGGTLQNQQEIPQFVLKLMYDDKVSKQESCSISMIPFRDLTTIGVTPCFHIFDALGLSRWIQSHRQCPLCRSQITSFQTYNIYREH
jgi:hypothetical protein